MTSEREHVDDELLFEVIFAVQLLAPVHIDRLPRWLQLVASDVAPATLLDVLTSAENTYLLRPDGEDHLFGPLGRGRQLLAAMPDRVGKLATKLWRENQAAEAAITAGHAEAVYLCPTVNEARHVLTATPFNLTADQADHLLEHCRMNRYTEEHRDAALKASHDRSTAMRTPPDVDPS